MSSIVDRFYENLHNGVIEEITMYRSEIHYCLAALKSDRVPPKVRAAASKMTVEQLYEVLKEEGLLPTSQYDFIPKWYARKWLTPKKRSQAQRIKDAKARSF